jgi:hypothetical protein
MASSLYGSPARSGAETLTCPKLYEGYSLRWTLPVATTLWEPHCVRICLDVPSRASSLQDASPNQFANQQRCLKSL